MAVGLGSATITRRAAARRGCENRNRQPLRAWADIWRSFTSWVISSGRNFEAKPSTIPTSLAFEDGAAAVAFDIHLEDGGVMDEAVDVGRDAGRFGAAADHAPGSDWFIEAILSIRRRAGMLELYQRIHGLTVPRAALCLSGGRIRSASFALGVRLSPPTGLLRHFRLRQYSLVRT